MAHEFAYVNGKIAPVEEAVVPVYDRSFLYGDGAFDTAVARHGRVFKLDAHLDRLLRSLLILRIPPPMTKSELREVALDLMRRNGMANGFLRIVVSRGTCPYISLKSNNYLNSILARWEAIDAGVDEALLLDSRGCVTEGSGDNVLAVYGDRLLTPPPLNILEGITRETILALASRVSLHVEVRDLTPYDLYTADEVFLTSTVVGVVPIVAVDGRTIGTGKAGPVARRLQALYDQVVLEEGTPIAG